jgi:YgiT-type zinc finger domain-containing protein
MTCFFCKGDLENSFTTHVAEIDESIIIVKSVPCLKCNQCGEISYSGTVYEHLEKIIDTLKNNMTEVTIVKYSGIAA